MSERPTQPPSAEETASLEDFEATIKTAGENHARLVRLLSVSGRTLSGATRAVKQDKEST